MGKTCRFQKGDLLEDLDGNIAEIIGMSYDNLHECWYVSVHFPIMKIAQVRELSLVSDIRQGKLTCSREI